MPHSFDLLVIGDANPDVILGPLRTPLAFGQREQLVDTGVLTLGGSAAIMACGAARLGLRVAFAGRIGDDGAGPLWPTAASTRTRWSSTPICPPPSRLW
jgi:sugar/nucleoside kinase (ribokinase family)